MVTVKNETGRVVVLCQEKREYSLAIDETRDFSSEEIAKDLPLKIRYLHQDRGAWTMEEEKALGRNVWFLRFFKRSRIPFVAFLHVEDDAHITLRADDGALVYTVPFHEVTCLRIACFSKDRKRKTDMGFETLGDKKTALRFLFWESLFTVPLMVLLTLALPWIVYSFWKDSDMETVVFYVLFTALFLFLGIRSLAFRHVFRKWNTDETSENKDGKFLE